QDMHILESLTTLRSNDLEIKPTSHKVQIYKTIAATALLLTSFSTSAQTQSTCPTRYLETSSNRLYSIEEFFQGISANGNSAYLVLDWPHSKAKDGVGIDISPLKGKPWSQWQKDDWQALIAALRSLPNNHRYMQQEFIHRPYLNNYLANK